MRLVAAAAVSVLACHHDAPPAQPKPPSTYEQLEAKVKPFETELGQLDALATAGHCPPIAASLRKFGAEHRLDLDDAARLHQQLTAVEAHEFEEEHGDDPRRLDAVLHRIAGACPGDAEIENALRVSGFVHE